MRLIVELSVLAGLMLLVVVLQLVTDTLHWRVPWYFLMELFLGLIPMTWLIWKVLPSEERASRLAFAATSAGFITLSAICELQAIDKRYWWFSEATDPLTHMRMGNVPLEEFFFYPLFLNLPILMYLRLKAYMAPSPPPKPLSATARRLFQMLGVLLGLAGLALIGVGLRHTTPAMDVSVIPAPDAAGAWRYSTGPAQHGWTIVQVLALSSICFWWTRLADHMDRRRLGLATAVFFVFALFTELMACGRGWYVWNEQQVLGLFNWSIPVDSYSMYFTGATMPIIVYEWLRGAFAEAPASSPSVALDA